MPRTLHVTARAISLFQAKTTLFNLPLSETVVKQVIEESSSACERWAGWAFCLVSIEGTLRVSDNPFQESEHLERLTRSHSHARRLSPGKCFPITIQSQLQFAVFALSMLLIHNISLQ
jgi:hypothetical protein